MKSRPTHPVLKVEIQAGIYGGPHGLEVSPTGCDMHRHSSPCIFGYHVCAQLQQHPNRLRGSLDCGNVEWGTEPELSGGDSRFVLRQDTNDIGVVILGGYMERS